MRVGVTGTRMGMTFEQKPAFEKVLSDIEEFEQFHHGDCVGVDAESHDIVRAISSDIEIVVWPPKKYRWRAFKKGEIIQKEHDYITRDHYIVDSCYMLIAGPNSMKEKIRSGTWATVRYARSKNKMITIIYPDGTIAREW